MLLGFKLISSHCLPLESTLTFICLFLTNRTNCYIAAYYFISCVFLLHVQLAIQLIMMCKFKVYVILNISLNLWGCMLMSARWTPPIYKGLLVVDMGTVLHLCALRFLEPLWMRCWLRCEGPRILALIRWDTPWFFEKLQPKTRSRKSHHKAVSFTRSCHLQVKAYS